MILALALAVALASAAAYGVSDFYGGVGAARLRVARGTALTFLVATLASAVALPFAGGRWSAAALAWGVVAGVFAILGILAFYGALVAGPMSLSAPLVGVVESAVPVAAAVVIGQRLGWLTWVAVVLACAGGALVSLRFGAGERMTARGLVLSLVAGALLGASILGLHGAPADSGVIPAFAESAAGFVVVGVGVALARVWMPARRLLARLDPPLEPDAPPGGTATGTEPAAAGLRLVAPALVAGVLMALGNILLVIALRSGPLAVVTVLVDLYPVATVLLARFVVRERLSSLQLVGVGLAVAASALFAVA